MIDCQYCKYYKICKEERFKKCKIVKITKRYNKKQKRLDKKIRKNVKKVRSNG